MIAPAVVAITALVFLALFGLHVAAAIGCPACQHVLARRQVHFQAEGAPGRPALTRPVQFGLLPAFAAIDRDFHTFDRAVAAKGDAVNHLLTRPDILIGIGAGAGDPRLDVHFPHGWLLWRTRLTDGAHAITGLLHAGRAFLRGERHALDVLDVVAAVIARHDDPQRAAMHQWNRLAIHFPGQQDIIQGLVNGYGALDLDLVGIEPFRQDLAARAGQILHAVGWAAKCF